MRAGLVRLERVGTGVPLVQHERVRVLAAAQGHEVQVAGLGRENGIEAVHEYTQTKAIWVELTGGTRDPFTLG